MLTRDTFFEVISPAHLYAAALVFAILTIVVVMVIYLHLYIKKRRFRAKSALNDVLDDWLGDLITDKEQAEIIPPDSVSQALSKEILRQFVIDKLIRVKKNISGASNKNIEAAYVSLKLRNDSISKMKSPLWYIKAKGIYELCMMDQKDKYDDILKYTNHRNRFVRREAQAATVGFAGFDGLEFLDNLTNPMLEWQQLKLLEQLQTENFTGLPHLPIWLKSENKYVVRFALKLTEIYQQFDAHDNVTACLSSDVYKIRTLAIKALGKIANSSTCPILRKHYEGESGSNQRLILAQLGDIGTEDDFDFLLDRLKEENDALKLEAMRAIVSIDEDAWSLLQDRVEGNVVLSSISKQVKRELAA